MRAGLLIRTPDLVCSFHNTLRHNQHAIIDAAGVVSSNKAGLFAPEKQAHEQETMYCLLKNAMWMWCRILRRYALVGAGGYAFGIICRGRCILFVRVERCICKAEIESKITAICAPAACYQFAQDKLLHFTQAAYSLTAGNSIQKQSRNICRGLCRIATGL